MREHGGKGLPSADGRVPVGARPGEGGTKGDGQVSQAIGKTVIGTGDLLDVEGGEHSRELPCAATEGEEGRAVDLGHA